MADPSYSNSGGFIHSLPSPTPSTASSRAAAGLPRARTKPLMPGSRKEDFARNYVSKTLMHISRRYVKHHGIPDPSDEVKGYENFEQVCDDLNGLIDVLWVSGTPSIQIPFLLDIAFKITEYIPSFPPSPRPTFALLKKLDHFFTSLLSGKDVRTGEPLTGFERGLSRGMTKTDMVRLKSMADETRLQVAIRMSGEAEVDHNLEENDEFTFAETPRVEEVIDTTHDFDRRSTISSIFKSEEEDDKESEDEILPPTTRKRKAGEEGQLPQTSKLSTAGTPPKRQTAVKVELRSPVGVVEPLDVDMASNGDQFHWALDDDDEDDENTQNPNQNAQSNTQKQQKTPPRTRAESAESADETGGMNGALYEYGPEVEEEELHMNVGKVYEKTIVELGKRLGESWESMVDNL